MKSVSQAVHLAPAFVPKAPDAISVRQGAACGFGLIRSRRRGVPVDFDVASLGTQAP